MQLAQERFLRQLQCAEVQLVDSVDCVPGTLIEIQAVLFFATGARDIFSDVFDSDCVDQFSAQASCFRIDL